MQAIRDSLREIEMTATTTTERDVQGRTPLRGRTATTDRAIGSSGTSGVVAGLLMVTGIGWNAGLEARPFQPVMMGVIALLIHIFPLVALMIFLVPVLRSGLAGAGKGRGVSVAAVLALAFGVFSAVFSVTYPHAVMGIHDVNDVLPIAILDAGALLWLVRGRHSRSAKIRRTTA
jgi:hypothetical protein